jgi:hypothetical protein
LNLRNIGITLIAWMLTACATGPQKNGNTVDAVERVERFGLRAVLASLLSQAQKELKNQPERALTTLETAWNLTPQLIDDRIVRAAISSHPQTDPSPTLRRVAHVAKAQDAFADNQAKEVRRLLVVGHTSHDLTEARRLLLLALVEIGTNVDAAKITLDRLANGDLTSEAGKELQYLARTTAASIDFDKQKLGPAIQSYLRVSEESAYWPTARTAIAWAQYQIGKYDRAIAGLKLLPEGLSTAPDRALLAAVCHHQQGQTKEALTVLAQAKMHKAKWLEGKLSPHAVLQAIKDEETPAGLIAAVAWHPPIRLVGREINATDNAITGTNPTYLSPLKEYRAQAWAKFESMITSKAARAREHATAAFEKLDILEPQLK